MWTIKRSNEDSPYYILPTSTCRVGRQGCQIIVQVSRHHADLSVIVKTCSYNDSTLNTTLKLKDVSKFVQTTVNDRLLSSNEREVSLNPGDIILFGACRDSFTVNYRRIVSYVEDLEEKPEIQSLAFQTGIPITESITECNFVISEELNETNLKHIDAVARCIRIVSSLYLSKVADCQSGVRVLPQMRDFEIDYPNKSQHRDKLFERVQFLICGTSAVEIRSLISSCGGCVVDANNLPGRELVIVNSDIDPAKLREPIVDCTLIDTGAILSMVYSGSTKILASLPKTTIGVQQSATLRKVRKNSDENWIQSGKSAGKSASEYETSERHGIKRFKKRNQQNLSNSIELEVWDGKDSTRRRRDAASFALTERNDVDEWFDSYSTQ